MENSIFPGLSYIPKCLLDTEKNPASHKWLYFGNTGHSQTLCFLSSDHSSNSIMGVWGVLSKEKC